jgi:hypothetical protein
MANVTSLFSQTFKAYGDLSSYQYHFVKMRGDNTVDICAATTDKPIGILQNTPSEAGRGAEVMLAGMSKIVAAETIAAGNSLGTDASGHAGIVTAATDKTQYIAGICTKAADVTEYAEIWVCTAAMQRESST